MTKVRKRNLKASRKPAITITRHGLGRNKLVYVAKANKSRKYRWGRSAVVYIGTTKAGVKRIADSAARKAETLLHDHGVKHLEFYVVSCRPLQGVETWRKLETALILMFREVYGEIPVGNTVGKGLKWNDELRYFSRNRLRDVLDRFSS